VNKAPLRDGERALPQRVGPKAAEDENVSSTADRRGLSLRAMLPNAITAAALCAGLTGVRFAIEGQWAFAILAVALAGVLDGIDGRIARLLKAQSRFGAELDSLADCLSFGMAPALILYMWSLKDLERFGWFAALAFAICCALRLARFNAQIDVEDQPHKSAGFLTGVPAPVGAGLAFTPRSGVAVLVDRPDCGARHIQYGDAELDCHSSAPRHSSVAYCICRFGGCCPDAGALVDAHRDKS